MLSEVYHPTTEDLARIRVRRDSFKVSGDLVFATQQGEGVTAGKDSIFFRLQLCNLSCGKPTGWQCDTGYTWDVTREDFYKEPVDWTIPEAAENIRKAWKDVFYGNKDERVVITGGEPLIQQRKIVDLVAHLPGWNVEIETNGTIRPLMELSGCQFNCSPKLANSGNIHSRRYKPEALKAISDMPNSWFKFVVCGVEDIAEIDEIISECQIPGSKVLVMPEGQTVESINTHLEAIEGTVVQRGWQITRRNQIDWFGQKRRT